MHRRSTPFTLGTVKLRRNGATPALLRRINAGLVLDTLRGSSTLRVIEIARHTELSRPTVDAAIDDLVRLGLVEESDADEQRAGLRGRPARHFNFRANAGHVLGMDIGVDQTYVIVADLRGDLVAEHAKPMPYELTRDERLAAITETVGIALHEAGLRGDELWGAGVGTPGIVDAAAGQVSKCEALPDWSDFHLAATMEQILGCPVVLENDANLGTIGERWRGSAQDVRDVIFFFFGSHVGAGIMVDDHLIRGHDGGAGELGFIDMWDRSADSVTRAGYVVATMAVLLAPELIVVAGRSGEEVPIESLRTLLHRLTNQMPSSRPRLEASALGAQAVAFGAVRHALDRIEPHLLDNLEV